MTHHANILAKRPKPLDQVKIIVTGKNPEIEALFKEWALKEGS